MQWIAPRDVAAPGVRLFCLPHAGSGVAGFYRWRRALPDTVSVCPVMLPGREARLGEPLLGTVGEIVDGVSEAAAGLLLQPYAVFGHSMGALLAFEWVRRIAKAKLPMPVCLFVSGREAPQMPFGHRELHKLRDEEFVSALAARYGGSPEALLEDPEMRDVFLPILRADLGVVESYAYAASPPLACPVMAMAGLDDRSVSDAGLEAWDAVAGKEFSQRRFPGDHFYHLGEGQAALLHVIAERMSR